MSVAAPAWKTATDVAEGYVLLNPVTLKRFESHELDALQKELEKLTRETRSNAVATDDAEAAQTRSRKLLRLSQAGVVLANYRSKMRK